MGTWPAWAYSFLVILCLAEVATAASGGKGLKVRVGVFANKMIVKAERQLPGLHQWVKGDRLAIVEDLKAVNLHYFWSSEIPDDAIKSDPPVACITFQLAYGSDEVPQNYSTIYLRKDTAGSLGVYTLGPEVSEAAQPWSNPRCPGAEYRGVEPEWWWCHNVKCPSRQSHKVTLPDGSSLEVEDPPGTCVKAPDGPGNCCVFNHGWANPLYCNGAESLFMLFECFRSTTLRGANPPGQTAVCPALANLPFGNFTLLQPSEAQEICSESCFLSLKGGLACFQRALGLYSKTLPDLEEPLAGAIQYLRFCTANGFNHTLQTLGVNGLEGPAHSPTGADVLAASTDASASASDASGSNRTWSLGATVGLMLAVVIGAAALLGGLYVLYVRRSNLQRSEALANFTRQFERPAYIQL